MGTKKENQLLHRIKWLATYSDIIVVKAGPSPVTDIFPFSLLSNLKYCIELCKGSTLSYSPACLLVNMKLRRIGPSFLHVIDEDLSSDFACIILSYLAMGCTFYT
jgi:hypothetical protein